MMRLLLVLLSSTALVMAAPRARHSDAELTEAQPETLPTASVIGAPEKQAEDLPVKNFVELPETEAYIIPLASFQRTPEPQVASYQTAELGRLAASFRPMEDSVERNLFLKRAPCLSPPCHAPLEYEFDLIDLGKEYRGGARF